MAEFGTLHRKFEDGTIVHDERGHLYRVLPTENAYLMNAICRVQPLTRRKNGQLKDTGVDRVCHNKFLEEAHDHI